MNARTLTATVRRVPRQRDPSALTTSTCVPGRSWPGVLTAFVRRCWPVMLAAIVVVADQAAKFTAGHAGPLAWMVNSGVDRDKPRILDPVWAAPLSGGLLDLLAVVGTAALAFAAVRTRGLIRLGLTLIAAGDASNLLDRFGASFLTAPDPHARGVVDLAVLGDANVADYAIKGGVIVLAVAALLHAAGGPQAVLYTVVRAVGRVRWRPLIAVVCTAVAGVWAGTVGQSGQTRKAQADAGQARWHANPATPVRASTMQARWVELPATARLADMRAHCHGDPFAVIPTRARILVRCRP